MAPVECKVPQCNGKTFKTREKLLNHWTLMHFLVRVVYFCPVNKCTLKSSFEKSIHFHLRKKAHRVSWRDASEREYALGGKLVLPQELETNKLYIDPGTTPLPKGLRKPQLNPDASPAHVKLFKSVNPYWREKEMVTPFVNIENNAGPQVPPKVKSAVAFAPPQLLPRNTMPHLPASFMPPPPPFPRQFMPPPPPPPPFILPSARQEVQNVLPPPPPYVVPPAGKVVQSVTPPPAPVQPKFNSPTAQSKSSSEKEFDFPSNYKELLEARAVAEKKISYWSRYLSLLNAKIARESEAREKDLIQRLKEAEARSRAAEAKLTHQINMSPFTDLDEPMSDFELA